MSRIDDEYRAALREAEGLSRGELLTVVAKVLHRNWERAKVHSGDSTQDGTAVPGPERNAASNPGNADHLRPGPVKPA